MRFALASSILLCLLAAQFPVNNAGVLPAKCRNGNCMKANGIEWSVVNDLSRRAGGGSGGGRGGGRGDGGGSTGGGGGTSGGGNGSPHSDGGQTGETGGFTSQETEGGFSPANPPANAPVNAPVNNPADHPSARNNFGNPAQSQEQTYNPSPPIDLTAKVSEFRTRIQEKGLQNAPWLFFSGFPDKDVVWKSQKILSDRLGYTRTAQVNGETQTRGIPSIEDVLAEGSTDLDRMRLIGSSNEKYFWAAASRAYAQAISGRVYVFIPEDRPINIPKDNGDGSVWWSFEAPDLSRNPGIDSITYVYVDPTTKITLNPSDPPYDLGQDRIIWRRGDPPLGTPGDERHAEMAPPQAWYG